MSTATMHFGPEWMRTKNQPVSRSQLEPSPPPANALPQAPSTLASYSALVSPTPVASEKLDESHPFRYSKEELLAVHQDGGGKGGLGLEVDRWEGVVREVAVEPVTLREMTDAEKKLFAGSLNSEMRRRPSQSTDHFSPLNISGLERPRMVHGGSATGSSPLRERFGAMKRKDSAGGTADTSSTSMPRKPSLSALHVPGVLSPTSRTRVAHNLNFDGVLNNGESWMARRRFSEASMKASNSSSTEGQAEDCSSKAVGIAEMQEEVPGPVCEEDRAILSPTPTAILESHGEISGTKTSVDATVNLAETGSLPTTYHDYQEIGHSPVILDLAAVEWSYKDPTGQVQGPFRADLMQKWYEEGYFTPGLPMKRTHLDSQWFTVQELLAQATGPNVFLTPPLPVGPPGPDQSPPLQTPESSHNEPFQPAPIRSLRTSTLESSLTGASLTSDSPSSSFGASPLGNSSPVLSTFIGRDRRPYGNVEAEGRAPSFGLHDLSTPGFISTRLNSDDFVPDLGASFEGQPSGSFVTELGVGLNGHVFNNRSPIVQDSWTGLETSSFGITNTNLTSSRSVPPTNFFNGVGRGYGFDLSGASSHLTHFGGPQSGSNPINYPSHELAGTMPFTGLVSQQPYAAQIPDFSLNQQLGQASGFRIQESIGPHLPPIHNGLPSGQSPWNVVPDSGIRASVAVAQRLEPTTHHENDCLNGVAVRGKLSNETFGSLNVEVDGQHNTSQELAQVSDEKIALSEQDSRTASASITTIESSLPSETGKLSTKASKPVSVPSLDQVTASDNSGTQVPPKFAWTKDEDGKGKKGMSTSISLRAIQEAEAKRQQSPKTTERERTRVSIASEAKEDSQLFTTSWGLPTSQTGARSNMITPAKELPAPSIATIQTPTVAPVWTTAAKASVVKKSMKEIQEEEEKCKKKAAKENSPSTTSKRAYVDTTGKTTLSSIPAVSSIPNVWATVGPNGKVTFPAQPSRASTQTTSFSSAVSGPSASRSPASPNQRMATTSVSKIRSVIKPGEVAETPSLEFLKWLGDSLKGLNSSANVEEIMSMLFSFPLDPDSSTLEIISDTIYANSTTLDGRRFAADFVAKRKADAASQSKGPADSGKAPTTKPVSIADVVKAVPKSTQPEWGFKVVNKKKKGGRS